MDSVKKLFGAGVAVLATGGAAASHVAWWLRYQMDGTARTDHSRDTGPPPPPKR